jgi:hypothetical protein
MSCRAAPDRVTAKVGNRSISWVPARAARSPCTRISTKYDTRSENVGYSQSVASAIVRAPHQRRETWAPLLPAAHDGGVRMRAAGWCLAGCMSCGHAFGNAASCQCDKCDHQKNKKQKQSRTRRTNGTPDTHKHARVSPCAAPIDDTSGPLMSSVSPGAGQGPATDDGRPILILLRRRGCPHRRRCRNGEHGASIGWPLHAPHREE